MRILPLLWLLAPVCLPAQDSQPIIPNGSFENWYENVSPEWIKKHSINCLMYWYQPTVGNPEYYRTDLKALGNLRDQKAKAHRGKGYAAFVAFAVQTHNYREFMGVRLNEKLVEGQKYRISFWLRIFPSSRFTTPDISAGFGSEKWISDTAFNARISHISETINHPIKDDQWEPVNIDYTGCGDEQYLIIGNFTPDSLCRLEALHPNSPMGAYYYIDDVEIVKTGEIIPEKIPVIHNKALAADGVDSITEKPFRMEPGMINELPRLHFAINSDALLESSHMEIERLFHFLASHPTLTINITGHTDSTGSDAYNALLSLGRAKAVAEALTSKGIDPERLHFTGMGSTMPVAPNNTEKNRQQNRRVEFVVIEE